MNTQLESVIKNKGYAPIYSSIDACIRDLKRAEYTKAEIKETLSNTFRGEHSPVNDYLTSKGY